MLLLILFIKNFDDVFNDQAIKDILGFVLMTQSFKRIHDVFNDVVIK